MADGILLKLPNSPAPTTNGLPYAKSFDIAIKEQPVTEERKPYIRKGDDPLVDAGTARANVAASKECPNGTEDGGYTKNHRNQTVCHKPCRGTKPD